MKVSRIILALSLMMSIGTSALAQDSTATMTQPAVWTLKDCIDWAKQQNITVQQKRVSARQAEIDLKDAKNERLPSVSFSTSQQFTNRPFAETMSVVSGDQVVTTSNKNVYSGSYYVGASMPLYDGGVIKNNIKLQEINTQIAALDIDATELSIEESITQVYVQILYSQDQIKQDKEQIELIDAQVNRAQELFKAGLLNKADVSQLQSTAASDRYQLAADESTLANYKLQLKQLLELNGVESIEIADAALEEDVLAPLPAVADVYATAVASRPEIRARQLYLDQCDLNEKIARAGTAPNISLSASVGTGNTTGNGNMFTQLKDQWSNGVGVTLSIPIWDHHKTSNAVERVRLDRENTRLELLNTEKTLWKTIETYWQNATSAQQRYIAAKANVDACRTSYDLTSEQFRLGLVNIVELMTDKTDLSTSTHQMLQAKYTALLNAALLKYYNGQTISL